MARVNSGDLTWQVEALQQQVDVWLHRIQAEEPPKPELFTEVILELSTALEELRVSQEELNQQNQELVVTRATVEVERQRYQALFEEAPDGYIVTDRQGIIREANFASSALLNIPKQYLIGKPIIIFVPESDRPEFRRKLAKFEQIDRIQEWSLGLQARGGKSFDASVSVTAVRDRQDKLESLRWLLRDVSAQKQAQEAILRAQLAETSNQKLEKEIRDRKQLELELRQQTEALEQASRSKDEFLAIVSHELRTPLNALLGWAMLLRTRKFDEKTTARALETIERNARLQIQLIEDILDVSRIIRGQFRLNKQPVNLVETIQAAIDAMNLAASAKEIQIETTLDPEAGLVKGDADRLQQVVWNLLSNAIKFTPKMGRIQVQLERIHASIEITVTDTGIGIPAESLPYIFDRFWQCESATTRCHGGLGLGLAIVRHLVELHGGTVRVESSGVGQGATFIVKLPLMPVRPKVKAQPPDRKIVAANNPPILDHLQVLVVDDELDARELIKMILQESGALVTTAASASEALCLIQHSKPDILISDIGMPNEDGYSLIRKLRKIEAQTQPEEIIPAVALTAFTREEDRLTALSCGFQAHLSKPVEPNQLVTVVASQLGRDELLPVPNGSGSF